MRYRDNVFITPLLIACPMVLAAALASSARAGEPLPECVIEFEGDCPAEMAGCGVSFTGNGLCTVDFLKFCYSSGLFAWRTNHDEPDPTTITFEGDVFALDYFFGGSFGGTGEMVFFDADGLQVDEPVPALGDCVTAMPDMTQVVFSRAVRSATVVAIDAPTYIDSFMINPAHLQPAADFNGDWRVNAADLAVLLGAWSIPANAPGCGGEKPCEPDINKDGFVNASDLALLLGAWTS